MSPDQKKIESLPVDVYVRVSRVGDREGENFISPEVQEERAKALVVSKGLTVGEVFVDLDESGRKMDRPEFNKALQRIREGRSGGIAVHKLDRFARNVRGLLDTTEEIESYGAAFLCVEPSIDTADPVYGEFLLTLFGAIARLESQKVKAGWRTTHVKAVGRGVKVSRPPVGYLKTDTGQLVPDEAVAPFITEAFERRARGETYTDIAAWLEEVGVEKPLRRETNEDGELVEAEPVPWGYRHVMDLLSREVYLGHIVLGDLRNENAHPALVDEETWLRVRARNGKPATKATTSAKGTHLLTGYIRCAGCGKAMVYGKSTARGKAFYRPRCKNDACKNKAGISQKELEGYVLARIAEAVVVEATLPRSGSLDRIEAARRRVQYAEQQLQDFEGAWQEQGLDPVQATKVLTSLARAVEEAQAELIEIPEDGDGDYFSWYRKHFRELGLQVEAELKEQGAWKDSYHSFEELTEADLDALTAKHRAKLTSLVEEGISGEELLGRLLASTGNRELDAEALLPWKRQILRRFLRKVTITGSEGPAEGRVEVELL